MANVLDKSKQVAIIAAILAVRAAIVQEFRNAEAES